MARREDILNGVFTFPKSIKSSFKLTEEQNIILEEFAQHVFNDWLYQEPTMIEIYIDRFQDEKLFFFICKMLSVKKWMTFETSNNIATCKLNDDVIKSMLSEDEISNLRYKYKFNKYILYKTESTHKDLVKWNNKYVKSGLIREGFCKAGNNKFTYDIPYLNKYKKDIVEVIIKKMASTTKDLPYQEMVDEIIDYYSLVNPTLTLGNNISDSRGRSIFSCTSKIGNPVSHKPMRHLIVLPKEQQELLDYERINDVYASIAELHGERPSTMEEKINIGRDKYLFRELSDNVTDNILLERIYDSLDNIDSKPWNVPIELDTTASVLTIMSVLTNNHEILNQVNLINPSTNNDAWTVDYCSRLHVKSAITPRLYGSSAAPRDLWNKEELEFTEDQVNSINNELLNGRFKSANEFKDFIITNVNPSEKMKVKIWNDEFLIQCNKFKWQATSIKKYLAFNSSNTGNNVKYIKREVALVPDLEQFKRYFATLLVHCCDSQIADHICNNLDWVISNHDAWLIHPNNIPKLKKIYLDKLYELYINRHSVLKNYFKSIGIEYQNMDVDSTELTREQFSGNNLK